MHIYDKVLFYFEKKKIEMIEKNELQWMESILWDFRENVFQRYFWKKKCAIRIRCIYFNHAFHTIYGKTPRYFWTDPSLANSGFFGNIRRFFVKILQWKSARTQINPCNLRCLIYGIISIPVSIIFTFFKFKKKFDFFQNFFN